MKKPHRLLCFFLSLCLCFGFLTGCTESPTANDPSVLLPALASEQDTGLGEYLAHCTGVIAVGFSEQCISERRRTSSRLSTSQNRTQTYLDEQS